MTRVPEADDCSVIELAHILGKRWTIPIVEEVYFNYGGIHFNGLLNSIDGITLCMLSRTLRELHAEGILEKKSVELNKTTYINYSLTQKGVLLAELIDKAKELCLTCCPLGDSCKYSRRRHVPSSSDETHPTLISESRRYK